MPLTPPYPTATIYVPWDELEAGVQNLSVETLDVAGDIFCGDDLGVVSDIAAGGTVTAGGSVVTADGVYEHGRAEAMGEWHDVPYNAANFTASVGSWTVGSGDVNTYAYTLVGQTMFLSFVIFTTSVSAAPVFLFLNLNGFTASREVRTLVNVIDAGVSRVGQAFTVASSGLLWLLADQAATPWATTAGNDTYVMGQIAIPITI
jgi:hypothetical protein